MLHIVIIKVYVLHIGFFLIRAFYYSGVCQDNGVKHRKINCLTSVGLILNKLHLLIFQNKSTMGNLNRARVLEELKQEVERTRDEMNRKLDKLQGRIERAEKLELISPKKAAEILGITMDAIYKRAGNGTLTKYNKDGSRKITNRRTPIYFNRAEVENRI